VAVTWLSREAEETFILISLFYKRIPASKLVETGRVMFEMLWYYGLQHLEILQVSTKCSTMKLYLENGSKKITLYVVVNQSF